MLLSILSGAIIRRFFLSRNTNAPLRLTKTHCAFRAGNLIFGKDIAQALNAICSETAIPLHLRHKTRRKAE